MKKLILILILFLGISNVIGQSKNEKLQNYKIDLSHRIQLLQDSLNIISNQINNELIFNGDNIDHVDATINNSYTYLYNDTDVNQNYGRLPNTAIVKIFNVYGEEDRFYKVMYGNQIGLVLSVNVNNNKQVTDFIESIKQKKKREIEERKMIIINQERENDIKIKIEKEKKIKKENDRLLSLKQKHEIEVENKRLSDLAIRNNKLIKSYGVEIANRLINKEIWIGMTTEMARVSLGEPKKNNRSVGSWGVHEQWVYYSQNLYFENGVLSSLRLNSITLI